MGLARNTATKASYLRSMIDIEEKLLWTVKETAQRLSMSEQALRDILYKGGGPKVTRNGRSVYFRPCDVHTWVNDLAFKS